MWLRDLGDGHLLDDGGLTTARDGPHTRVHLPVNGHLVLNGGVPRLHERNHHDVHWGPDSRHRRGVQQPAQTHCSLCHSPCW